MYKYTINSINEETGVPNITYVLSDGETENTENLFNAVGLDKEQLDNFMNNYCQDYETGLEVEHKKDADIATSISVATPILGTQQSPKILTKLK